MLHFGARSIHKYLKSEELLMVCLHCTEDWNSFIQHNSSVLPSCTSLSIGFCVKLCLLINTLGCHRMIILIKGWLYARCHIIVLNMLPAFVTGSRLTKTPGHLSFSGKYLYM